MGAPSSGENSPKRPSRLANVVKVSIVVNACAHIDEDGARIALAYLERVVGVQIEYGGI